MPDSNKVRILNSDRLSDGIVVKFADGTCIFFPALLLRDIAPLAIEQDEKRAAW